MLKNQFITPCFKDRNKIHCYKIVTANLEKYNENLK
jgi:hypothetical protein